VSPEFKLSADKLNEKNANDSDNKKGLINAPKIYIYINTCNIYANIKIVICTIFVQKKRRATFVTLL
tara:strand:- start:39 stop:239 length:201 start_codon:yes stop_codon:yes gene_type:complete